VRVLLSVHHRLNPYAGAPGVTLALGEALQAAGCEVGYFAYDQAFPRSVDERVGRKLRFPWHLAAFLVRHAREVDVVDASTGDAWLWASLRRPGGRGRTALITRAHGLEHVADERTRRAAQEVGAPLSWKYPIYHGGLRLWEVRRSLVLADHCILLNPLDRDYVRSHLRVPSCRTSVIPNAIADHFHEVPAPEDRGTGPVRLAFIGRWTTYKGKETLVEAAVRLEERGVAFALSVLGAGSVDAVLTDFPEAVRSRVTVTTAFANEDLPRMLAGHEVFVFPTLSEGSSGSLIEAMACGLAPVATAVGAAPEVVEHWRSGLLVDLGDAEGIAGAVQRLAADRVALLGMRRRAHAAALAYRWSDVAARTLRVYERALATRSTADTKRGPTLRHV
jgi:glycosyltransferase involved in cell wall biosynthesis